jgi:hypothetical protein
MARQARRRWEEKHPEAAREICPIESRHGHVPREDFERLKERDPEAASDLGRLTLYGADVIRQMRMAEPQWEPPDPTSV